ncbi:hypothetical protein OsJ_31702 [Oryza sativa Japonica Group]|uniref:OSJNBb0089K06.21 protein n=1 Tax=Oryza sativa subsp. japonica TaxID=39947 RepID=A0A8I3B0W7_ORYSJ|nr:hypothetical protein OsJ_31702 [Oryza sativa Japonica Group]CAD39678.1 OSJNBb0089K06.21 [Oryza sativa Japonica Group]CAI44600.1 P0650D04.4 [Oryza sativa Japonica Group]
MSTPMSGGLGCPCGDEKQIWRREDEDRARLNPHSLRRLPLELMRPEPRGSPAARIGPSAFRAACDAAVGAPTSSLTEARGGDGDAMAPAAQGDGDDDGDDARGRRKQRRLETVTRRQRLRRRRQWREGKAEARVGEETVEGEGKGEGESGGREGGGETDGGSSAGDGDGGRRRRQRDGEAGVEAAARGDGDGLRGRRRRQCSVAARERESKRLGFEGYAQWAYFFEKAPRLPHITTNPLSAIFSVQTQYARGLYLITKNRRVFSQKSNLAL